MVLIFTHDPLFIILIEFNRRVYVHEDGVWAVKGRYQSALEDDDVVAWDDEDGKLILRIAAVIILSHKFLSILMQEFFQDDDDDIPKFAKGHSHQEVSLTSSIATPSVPTVLGPSFTSFREQLITLLHIPLELTSRAPADLRKSYKKYLAYLQAFSMMEKKVAAETWPGKKPSATDIVECFISKTFWHDYYMPTFSKMSSYPTMVRWLEGGDDAPSALEAWGIEKSVYVFKDLVEFLNNGGQLSEDRGKVKTKRKVEVDDQEVVKVTKKVAGKKVAKKVVKKVAKKVAKKVEKMEEEEDVEVEDEDEESPRRNKKRRVSS